MLELPILRQEIYGLLENGRQSGQYAPRSARWLDSNLVVNGTLNPLLATEISFGCLNRNVTEQKLNLLQFAPSCVTESSASLSPMPNAA